MNTQSANSLQAAATHFHAGRLQQAADLCRQIIKQDPHMIDALHLLALIHEPRTICKRWQHRRAWRRPFPSVLRA